MPSVKVLQQGGSTQPAGIRSHRAVREAHVSDVQQVTGTNTAFAAVRADGSVVTWGNPGAGGDSTGLMFLLGGKLMFRVPKTI